MGLQPIPGAFAPTYQELNAPTYAQQMARRGDMFGGAALMGFAGGYIVAGEIGASIAPATPLLPRISDTLFARGYGLVNSNDYIRIGFGWSGSATAGNRVFRFVIGSEGMPIYWHVFEINLTDK